MTKEYVTWKEMIRRCYAPNASKKFPAYVDVTVCERWKCFQYFCEDIQHLEGYDKWKNNDGHQLDKDILCEKNDIKPKIYSPETCIFLSRRENISESTTRKNLTGLVYIGVSPEGVTYEFTNQKEFSKRHGLNNSLVNGFIHGKINYHKGWTFKIKDAQ